MLRNFNVTALTETTLLWQLKLQNFITTALKWKLQRNFSQHNSLSVTDLTEKLY